MDVKLTTFVDTHMVHSEVIDVNAMNQWFGDRFGNALWNKARGSLRHGAERSQLAEGILFVNAHDSDWLRTIQITCSSDEVDSYARQAFDSLYVGDQLTCVRLDTHPAIFLPWNEDFVGIPSMFALWKSGAQSPGTRDSTGGSGFTVELIGETYLLDVGGNEEQAELEAYLAYLGVPKGNYPFGTTDSSVEDAFRIEVNKRLLHDSEIKRGRNFSTESGSLVVLESELDVNQRYIREAGRINPLFKVFNSDQSEELIIESGIREISHKDIEFQ